MTKELFPADEQADEQWSHQDVLLTKLLDRIEMSPALHAEEDLRKFLMDYLREVHGALFAKPPTVGSSDC